MQHSIRHGVPREVMQYGLAHWRFASRPSPTAPHHHARSIPPPDCSANLHDHTIDINHVLPAHLPSTYWYSPPSMSLCVCNTFITGPRLLQLLDISNPTTDLAMNSRAGKSPVSVHHWASSQRCTRVGCHSFAPPDSPPSTPLGSNLRVRDLDRACGFSSPLWIGSSGLAG